MDIERCGAPIRYYKSAAEPVVEPCDREPHTEGRHQTATARARRKAIKKRHDAKNPGQRRRRENARARRRYARDPIYRAKKTAQAAAWLDAHPLQVELYKLKAHSGIASAMLDELTY